MNMLFIEVKEDGFEFEKFVSVKNGYKEFFSDIIDFYL